VSRGNLRSRFTHDVKKAVVPAAEFREHLRTAPGNQLLLSAVHATRDTLLLDRYENRMADRGFDFEVYEMESGIGGLWWSQTYPGVAGRCPSGLTHQNSCCARRLHSKAPPGDASNCDRPTHMT
jgi:hypothetical protein